MQIVLNASLAKHVSKNSSSPVMISMSVQMLRTLRPSLSKQTNPLSSLEGTTQMTKLI